MRVANGYTFFFTERDVFSNWYRASFTIRGITFNCVEQYMMFYKAKLFENHALADQILKESHPKRHKAMGRDVTGYNDAVWSSRRMRVVTHACLAKFHQNPDLSDALKATIGTTLVEASPYDRLWGVGLGENDPKILDPRQWRGKNLLGQALMDARQQLFPVETAGSNDSRSS